MGNNSSSFYEHLSYFKDEKPYTDNKMFTDQNFPPTEASLMALDKSNKPIDERAYKENKDDINPKEIEFIRISELYKGQKYDLFLDETTIDDIKQGGLGDCYFLSSLASLTKYPQLIDTIFKTEGISPNGYYEIILFIDGKPQIVIVDDYVPVYKKNKYPCFARPNGNEVWVMLAEKAWAKVNGGYLNIIGGNPHEVLQALTGFCSSIFDFSKRILCDFIANIPVLTK